MLDAVQVFMNYVLCRRQGLPASYWQKQNDVWLAGHFVGLTPFWWGGVNQRLRYYRCGQPNPGHKASVRV